MQEAIDTLVTFMAVFLLMLLLRFIVDCIDRRL